MYLASPLLSRNSFIAIESTNSPRAKLRMTASGLQWRIMVCPMIPCVPPSSGEDFMYGIFKLKIDRDKKEMKC